jgi:hypothetical protein
MDEIKVSCTSGPAGKKNVDVFAKSNASKGWHRLMRLSPVEALQFSRLLQISANTWMNSSIDEEKVAVKVFGLPAKGGA